MLDYMPNERKESVASDVAKRIVAAVFCGCFTWMAIGMGHERSSAYYPPALVAASGAILCFLVAIGRVR
jgi:hypothetical protein